MNISRLMSDPLQGIASIDINPVMLDARGHVAVDAVVFRSEQS